MPGHADLAAHIQRTVVKSALVLTAFTPTCSYRVLFVRVPVCWWRLLVYYLVYFSFLLKDEGLFLTPVQAAFLDIILKHHFGMFSYQLIVND